MQWPSPSLVTPLTGPPIDLKLGMTAAGTGTRPTLTQITATECHHLLTSRCLHKVTVLLHRSYHRVTPNCSYRHLRGSRAAAGVWRVYLELSTRWWQLELAGHRIYWFVWKVSHTCIVFYFYCSFLHLIIEKLDKVEYCHILPKYRNM